MVAPILLLSTLAAAHSAAVALMSGGIGVVQGPLTGQSLTASPTPQTVHIIVNNAEQTFTGVVVLGAPGSTVNQGQPVTLVLKGSTPFIGSFQQTSMVVDELQTPDASQSALTVPMSAAGQLQVSFLVPKRSPSDGVQFNYPAFTVGGYNFINGLTMKWRTFPAHYRFSLPSNGSAALDSVTFPSGPSPYHLFFQAVGASTVITVQGDGAVNPLSVTGTDTGVATVFTSALLEFAQGTSN
jgi:hypothetical protein